MLFLINVLRNLFQNYFSVKFNSGGWHSKIFDHPSRKQKGGIAMKGDVFGPRNGLSASKNTPATDPVSGWSFEKRNETEAQRKPWVRG